jgi:phosphopantetheine attachment domain protein
MREDILDKVLKVLNTNLENTEITFEQTEDDLSALGMDSITFIRTIVALEEEFDIEIPDEYLLLTEMNTISKMTDVISAVLDNQNNSIGE